MHFRVLVCTANLEEFFSDGVVEIFIEKLKDDAHDHLAKIKNKKLLNRVPIEVIKALTHSNLIITEFIRA